MASLRPPPPKSSMALCTPRVPPGLSCAAAAGTEDMRPTEQLSKTELAAHRNAPVPWGWCGLHPSSLHFPFSLRRCACVGMHMGRKGQDPSLNAMRAHAWRTSVHMSLRARKPCAPPPAPVAQMQAAHSLHSAHKPPHHNSRPLVSLSLCLLMAHYLALPLAYAPSCPSQVLAPSPSLLSLTAHPPYPPASLPVTAVRCRPAAAALSQPAQTLPPPHPAAPPRPGSAVQGSGRRPWPALGRPPKGPLPQPSAAAAQPAARLQRGPAEEGRSGRQRPVPVAGPGVKSGTRGSQPGGCVPAMPCPAVHHGLAPHPCRPPPSRRHRPPPSRTHPPLMKPLAHARTQQWRSPTHSHGRAPHAAPRPPAPPPAHP